MTFLDALQEYNDSFMETVYDELEYLRQYGQFPNKTSGLEFNILRDKMNELYGKSDIDSVIKHFYQELGRRYRYNLKS